MSPFRLSLEGDCARSAPSSPLTTRPIPPVKVGACLWISWRTVRMAWIQSVALLRSATLWASELTRLTLRQGSSDFVMNFFECRLTTRETVCERDNTSSVASAQHVQYICGCIEKTVDAFRK